MNIARLILVGLLFTTASLVKAQSIVDWTAGPGPLGLGYPVPIPADTPLPFDGFRSFAGLHTRHQDLSLEHDFIGAGIVGQTVLDRDIWAYRLGRGESETWEGQPRAALQFTGGIHAREWQSPEVVTGLLELLAEGSGDGYWLDYVLDHTSIVLVPVLNVDGFLQTQRYPRSNWLGVDNRFPETSPRDGRMRRKNLRAADENLETADDRLRGVDLNRNNSPAWPGPQDTALPNDLTYRGTSPASEPEITALQTAAELGPAEQLRFYADMHSYTRVFFSVLAGSARRNAIQQRVLAMASNHHADLPGSQRYVDDPGNIQFGIGVTSEYFASEWQVPSLTWEIEPGPSGGSQYGGLGSNGHDGFILPESDISRVRENLAETMTAIAYHMAGPPRLVRAELFDASGRFVHWSGRWRESDAAGGTRQLVTRSVRPVEAGDSYRLRLVFSKPMRWRESGTVVPFPGFTQGSLSRSVGLEVDGTTLDIETSGATWSGEPDPWNGKRPQYRDNTLTVTISIADTADNRSLLESAPDELANLAINVADMTGHRLDSDPATPVQFQLGAWQGYNSHTCNPDVGGIDRTLQLDTGTTTSPITAVGAGHTAMWFDPDRSGEGWMLEILPDNAALAYWFTFDEQGDPRWLIGSGTVDGNRIEFPELFVASGAKFGSAFDPGDVALETVGSARMVFTGCQSGWYEYEAFDHHRTIDFEALTDTLGTQCGTESPPAAPDRAALSGSWYDPEQSGQGLTLQWVSSESMLLVWFTFDSEGNSYWIIGQSQDGSLDPIVFPELLAVRGPVFGDDFDPEDAQQSVWGQAELTLGCDQGLFEYDSNLPEFEDGALPLDRLTRLAGLDCNG